MQREGQRAVKYLLDQHGYGSHFVQWDLSPSYLQLPSLTLRMCKYSGEKAY